MGISSRKSVKTVEFLSNGKELMRWAPQLMNYFDAKKQVATRSHQQIR